MMLKYAWKKKITPFQVARGFGQRWCRNQIDAYLSRVGDGKDQMMSVAEKQVVADYIYHLFMREGTSEFGLLVMFTNGL